MTAAARQPRSGRWPGLVAWLLWALAMLTLAAVGASTLAGLGLWLGYRRRHLAGLSR